MNIDITGKFNDWTLFTYRYLFGSFSRKAETCRTWKINASFILSPKSCWGYTIILISFCSAYLYLQNRIGVYDLIEHIFRYFKICPYKFILTFSYLEEVITSKLIIWNIKWDTERKFISCWTIWCQPHCDNGITFGTGGQNAMKKQ